MYPLALFWPSVSPLQLGLRFPKSDRPGVSSEVFGQVEQVSGLLKNEDQRTRTVTCVHPSLQAVMEMDTAHPFFPPACWVCSAQRKRQLVPPRTD